jgi:hypothetical protein
MLLRLLNNLESFMFDAAYVGLATVAGFIWWFVYADSGPKLPYTELVSIYHILVCGLCF